MEAVLLSTRKAMVCGDASYELMRGSGIVHHSSAIPREKHVRRYQANVRLYGAERSEGSGKLACRRPLQLQVRHGVKGWVTPIRTWHEERTLMELQ